MSSLSIEKLKTAVTICLASASFSFSTAAEGQNQTNQNLNGKSATSSVSPSKAEPKEISVRLNGKEISLEKLDAIIRTGLSLGLIDKSTFERFNIGDRNPESKTVEPFTSNSERLAAIVNLVEKPKVEFKYQGKLVTASLSDLHTIITYGLDNKYFTPHQLNPIGHLDADKVIADNPDVKGNQARIKEIRDEVNKRNSEFTKNLAGFMDRYGEDLWAIKSLKDIPSWEQIKSFAGIK